MARLLGEARVSVLPDGTRFKPEAEAAVKRATEGLKGKVKLDLDTKGLNAQLAAERAKIIAAQNSIAKARAADAKIAEREIVARGKMYASMFDKISKSEAMQAAREAASANASKQAIDRIAKAREADAARAAKDIDKRKNMYASMFEQISKGEAMLAAREAANATASQKSIDRIAKARQDDILNQQKGIQATRSMYAKLFNDLDKRDNIKVGIDGAYTDKQMAAFRGKIDALTRKTSIRLGLEDGGLTARVAALRTKLKAELSDIKVKVKAVRDNFSFASVLSFIGGRFTKDLENAGGNSGNKFGSGFLGGLAKSALMQNPGITAAVIAGLAALPAAVGAIGVLGGIALGAGLVFGAQKLIKSQIKTITAGMRTLQTAMGGTPTSTTAIANQKLAIQSTQATIARLSASKSLTATQSQQLSIAKQRLAIQNQALTAAQSKGQGTAAQQQQLKSDQAQLAQLNKDIAAFKVLNTAVRNLRDAFLRFAIVASKPLIKPFADALNGLSKQLRGPLATAFILLFKAVGPLVKPVVESLLLIVKGILPGLTDMLNKARGPLSVMFTTFGRIVGLKVGQWFRDAIPYIQVSATYFNKLIGILGSLGSFLIKFGGESAKAFAGSQFKGFGKDIQSLANSLLKLLIPAFEGWTGVILPVAKLLIQIITPMLRIMAANPALVKVLAGLAAAWFLVGKAVVVATIAMKIFGVSSATILAAAPWVALAAAIVIAVVLIIKNWKPISAFFVNIWKHIWSGFIGPMINFFTNTIPHAFGVTLNWLKKNWPLLVTIIGGPFAMVVIHVVKYHKQILNAITGAWGRIENVVTGIVKPIVSVVVGVWHQIFRVTKNVWNAIYQVIRIPVLIILGLIGELVIGVRNAFNAVWPYIYRFTKTVWGNIENVITGIAKPIASVVVGAWNVIKNATQAVWNWIFSTTKAIWGHVENVITGIVKPVASVVVGAWNIIKSATQAAWNWVSSFSSSVWNHIKNVITGIVKPIVSVITGAWNTIKSVTQAAFNIVHTYIISPLQKAWDWISHTLVPGIEGAFHGLVDTVKTIWHTIESAVATPINFVINDVWNPFAGFVNKGLSIFGINKALPHMNPVKFATGGHVPGYSPGKDTVPAMLSPGEFVINPVSARVIGVDNLHAMNSMKFAKGGGVPIGVTNPSPNGNTSALNAKAKAHAGGGIPIISPAVHLGKELLAKGADWAIQHFLAPVIEKIAGASGAGNIMGQLLPAVFKTLENGVLAWAGAHGQPGPAGPGSGPAGGATGTDMANGLELYNYLLTNLFGGNKIAAAGATASIWGESTWNPFAQGTGGRGLIGWTPPGTISDAAFKGGMRTQLPEIINFVVKNGDMGAIHAMEGTSTVLDAANIWGKQVERYGINDVHSAGIALATQFMNAASPQSAHATTPKGTKAAQQHASHKTHFASGGEVLAFGGSATQGVGASKGKTYEDDLAKLLRGYSVKNAGVSGNRITKDLGRFRSSIDPRTRAAVLWEGNNDIAAGVGASAIEGAYRAAIADAHAANVDIVGGTLQPASFSGKRETERRAVNHWIMGNSSGFDAVADFDFALRDPKHPNRMAQKYASSAGPAHPGNAGYAKIASVAAGALTKAFTVKTPVQLLHNSEAADYHGSLKAAAAAKSRGNMGGYRYYMAKAADYASRLAVTNTSIKRARRGYASGGPVGHALHHQKLTPQEIESQTLAELGTHSQGYLRAMVFKDKRRMASDSRSGNARDYLATSNNLDLVNTALANWKSPLQRQHDTEAHAYHLLIAEAAKAKAHGNAKGYLHYSQQAADYAKEIAETDVAMRPRARGRGTHTIADPILRLATKLSTSGLLKKLAHQLEFNSVDPSPVGRLTHADMTKLTYGITPDVLDAIYSQNVPALAGSLKGRSTNYAGQNPGLALSLMGKLSGVHGVFAGRRFSQGGMLPAGLGFGVAGGVPFSFNEGGNREKIVPAHVQTPGEPGMTANQAERLIDAVNRNTAATVAVGKATNKNLSNVGQGMY